MPDTNTPVQYVCTKCKYTNIWTRDEIQQRGKEVIYRGDQEVEYSLSCKSGCGQRMRVALKLQGG